MNSFNNTKQYNNTNNKKNWKKKVEKIIPFSVTLCKTLTQKLSVCCFFYSL